MSALYYTMCALAALRAYADACAAGAPMSEILQRDNYQESE